MNKYVVLFKYAFAGIHYHVTFLMICLWMLSFHSMAQLTTITVGNATRSMLVYAPAGIQQNRPLLISMHGLNQDPNYQKSQTKWELVADTAKFIVVYPAGINNSWDLSGNTDTDFILKIIDAMYTSYGIDRSRVYLSGFSMGGMMTYVAATKIADKIAAFAPVSGYPLSSSNFNSSRVVPFIHIHGDADNVVIYDNKLLTYLQGWRTKNGCSSTAVVTKPYPSNISNSVATKSSWTNCGCGTEFVLMTLAGKGHWHSLDATFNSTVEIWNFVRKYKNTCGNVGPVVSLTAPVNNTVYTEGDNITINATATITSGSISKVEFYNGTTLLGTDASSPYSYTITAAAAGTYPITAKATSAANAVTTSTAINIQVAKPIYQTGSAPTIDGTVDGLWSSFPSTGITKNNTGTISSGTDLSGNWKAMWDASNLYVLVQVTDDVKRNDGGTDVYNDDGVEVYIDLGNTKATTYGTNDQQYTFRWNDVTAAYEINGHPVTGITKGISNTATGYIVEVSIPWSTIGGTASLNSFQGFEVMINDDDDGGAREGKLAWVASTDDTWSNPALMGTVVLKGLNCTVPAAAITASTATTFCSGGSVVLNAGTGTGYSYVWKNGTATIAGATNSGYTATASGSYTVTVTNPGGCSATSAGTTVTVNALPVLTQYAQVDGGTWNQVSGATVCAGSSVVLGPQPTVNTGWSWTGPNGYSASTREITLTGVTPTQGGIYTASYTDGNMCKSTSAFTLTVTALPTATITATGSTTIPQGGSVVLQANAGSALTYKWFNGTVTITGATAQTYTATNAGSYTVEVTNAGNCKATSAAATVSVVANQPSVITITSPAPNAAVTGAIDISVNITDADGSITLVEFLAGDDVIGTAAAAPYTYTWDTPTAGSHTITVRVTDSNGGVTTSGPVTVTSESITTGVQALNTLNAAVYPNPSNGIVFIDTDADLSDASFTLIDVLGKEGTVSSTATGNGAMIDVSSLAGGTYMLIIHNGNATLRKKFNVVK
ncbi:CHU large protein; esterase-related protein, CBM9 module, carbohydrate esterase family 1 protein [Cytophaga hutchinsonii ATCC 33406]|uniref:CHU large protein esterase-related protein, CBM9 module, carbohydrate esterase family 1 protein n=4 Tax=Cytophaga hutchinsonii TaxID=985 RepID=A0A6N4SSF0_CYTH3|nr:CHU large protein; esterase-related protein, CBM9 module, carbohydrate esterase family 1 protein [Cytophaga hutchinsonii ATCC 33406]